MMRMLFGQVAIVISETESTSYELTAHRIDNVENLEPLPGIAGRTVHLSELFAAASELAELAQNRLDHSRL